jgi:methylamine dehydrogenase heavy chain
MSLMLAAASLPAAAAAPKAPPPELPAETLVSGGSLAAAGPERIYVGDTMIGNIVDGRVRVFDARRGKLLGMVNAGYAANFALSAKADELYVATTYLSRGGRGERSDVLEVWNTDTLAFKYEVLLPPRRAQTLSYRGLVSASADGRFLLVQNATPATSLTVVDLGAKKVAAEIPTAGCWGSLPAAGHPARFSMLCGDGKVATVTLDAQGQVAERQLSEKFFDADQDAWYHTSERVGDRYYFLSFKGTLTELDLSGPVARQVSQKAIVTPQQAKQGWRPGGYQVFSVHPDGTWAVVAMHDQGREGSHKAPAKQLWSVDLQSGRRIATAPGLGTASLTFSKNGKRLQALDGVSAALRVWDVGGPGRLKLVSTVKPAGSSALQLETHD